MYKGIITHSEKNGEYCTFRLFFFERRFYRYRYLKSDKPRYDVIDLALLISWKTASTIASKSFLLDYY